MSFKIALIAMSGVRAFKPELNALGMTLPGFVERGRIVAAMPSLSLLTLAGMTPERFEVGYHEIADIRWAGELPNATWRPSAPLPPRSRTPTRSPAATASAG
jgi:hypothetical protein